MNTTYFGLPVFQGGVRLSEIQSWHSTLDGQSFEGQSVPLDDGDELVSVQDVQRLRSCMP